MKRQFLCLLLAIFASVSSFSQTLTSTAPNGVFTKNDIQFWVGSGTNEAAFVIVFNDSKTPNALVWGYRWNGTKTMWQMLADVASEDPRFFYMGDGQTLGGFGIDVNEDGQFSLYKSNNVSNVIYPTNGILTGTGLYNYDDWLPSNSADRWVSGWGDGYWFLSNGGVSSQISANSWQGATFTSFGGGGISEGLSDATYTAVLPPASSCSKPTNLASSQITSSQASISWSDNNTNWILDYKTTTEQSWTSISVNSNPYIINQLNPQTEYNVRIRSLCSASDTSEYSDTLNFTTLSLPCNKPESIVFTNITDSSVIIDWTSENSNSWIIDYRVEDTENWNKVIATDKPYQITELFPQTEYNVRIRSLCSASDTSEYSDTLNFTTLSLPCNKPEGLSITSITDTSALIAWNASQANQWEVSLDTLLTPIILSDTNYLFQDLTSLTSYTAFVRTKCDENTYSQWDSINFTTLNRSSLNYIYNQNLSIKIYPNPASKSTNLNIEGFVNDITIKILDIQARELFSMKSKKNEKNIKLDLSNITSGLYYIKISDGITTKTEKLIIN